MAAATSYAALVWDGDATVRVPTKVGVPHAGQMKGPVGEQLIELATRVCYDSLGIDAEGNPKGRDSVDTLKNVMDQYHGSVLEHYVKTVEVRSVTGTTLRELVAQAFAGRPGCTIRMALDPHPQGDLVRYRITMNARAAVEWATWDARLLAEHGYHDRGVAASAWSSLGRRLQAVWQQELPTLVKITAPVLDPNQLDRVAVRFVEPETDSEKHITMFLVGSRGFSHEMVRHRFAISQRSTRYCEEGSSPWHWHPSLRDYCATGAGSELAMDCVDAERHAKQVYEKIATQLTEHFLKALPESMPYRKKHARKQARGAARGFLGNALETQMFFTAPVWAWRHIANMRAADAADAEIRVVIAEALAELQQHSRYADRFLDLKLAPASDGLGMALVGGGHK